MRVCFFCWDAESLASKFFIPRSSQLHLISWEWDWGVSFVFIRLGARESWKLSSCYCSQDQIWYLFTEPGALHTERFRQHQTNLVQREKKILSEGRSHAETWEGKEETEHLQPPSQSFTGTYHPTPPNHAKPNGFAGTSCCLPSLWLCSYCLLCLSCNPPLWAHPNISHPTLPP